MLNDLEWICDWYRQRCDGDWEHEFGVTVETLDNPGWSLRVDLGGTPLSLSPFSAESLETGDEWMRVWKDDETAVFHAAGSPAMLPVMLDRFRTWATSAGEA